MLDLEAARAEKERNRRARYRGFRDVYHFLDLAEQRTELGTENGSKSRLAAVTREYRIIFMDDPLDTLPFPIINQEGIHK